MSAFYDPSKTPRKILNQAIVKNIVAESNGALLDPSDMSTMFQDAAGTTQVTAVEQPVGKILDKSGNGNHATQSVTASRPVLSARKNILLATETLATQSVTTIAAQHTLSFTGTGSVTLSGAATGTLAGTGADNRVSLTVTPTAGTLTLTVSGSVTKAQLELGAVAGPYQRVNTSTDYDTNPALFPKYLKFDGVDDYLNLPYMGLYANGSASVVVAASIPAISSDAYILAEANSGDPDTRYGLARVSAVTHSISSLIRTDEAVGVLQSSGIVVPKDDAIVASIVDTGASVTYTCGSESLNIPYIRTGTVSLNTTTVGAGVSTATIGIIKTNIYSLIITKSALTDAQRVRCERFLARKAGVML